MIALLKKEVFTFFQNITGYIIIGLFLIVLGLFLWFFPTEFNILQSGLASFEPMFILIPWMFLFFIPAITMKLFAEEKRQGTLELLITKPVSEFQIVLAKYLSALVIIIIAILPTLFYFIIVQYFLSNHSVDTGAFWGSFIGMILLASSFAAVGVYSSSLTDNQVVAFLLAIVILLILYLGFGLLSQLSFLRPVSEFIEYLGMDFHYQSLSKGVLDSRDLVYFLSVDALFILLTVIKLKSRN